jgi:hypothetical protein
MLLLYLAAVVCVYAWGLFYVGALGEHVVLDGLFGHGPGTGAAIVAALTMLMLFVALFLLLYRRQRMAFGATRVGEPRSVAMMLLMIGILPFALIATDMLTGWQLLDPSCSARHVPDYFWLTLDSLAKGAVLDVLESFHIDFYACGASRQSLIASAEVFGMRTFTTYIVVFGLVQIYSNNVRMRRDIILGPE